MNIDNYFLRAIYIINNKLNLISNNANIIGMGYGHKIINNNITPIPSLTFFVHKKLSESNLNPLFIIPKSLNGIITDVIESTKPKFCADDEKRPIIGGISIQNPYNNYWGTVGHIVIQNSTNFLGILTSGHVLRSTRPEKPHYLIQPKYRPKETIEKRKNTIIKGMPLISNLLISPKEPDSSLFNLYDVGILLIDKENSKTLKLLNGGLINDIKIPGVVPNLPIKDINLMDMPTTVENQICKIIVYGASSGKQEGEVLYYPYTYKHTFTKESNFYGKSTYFKWQLQAKINVDSGDSGSLGLRNSDNFAFGLLMSTTNSPTIGPLAIFNPLIRILQNYDLKLYYKNTAK